MDTSADVSGTGRAEEDPSRAALPVPPEASVALNIEPTTLPLLPASEVDLHGEDATRDEDLEEEEPPPVTEEPSPRVQEEPLAAQDSPAQNAEAVIDVVLDETPPVKPRRRKKPS